MCYSLRDIYIYQILIETESIHIEKGVHISYSLKK